MSQTWAMTSMDMASKLQQEMTKQMVIAIK